MTKKILKAVRFFICTALIYFVISQLDYEPLKEIFSELNLIYCLLILTTLYFQNVIKALKWHTLLAAKQIKIPLLRIIQVDFASTFLTLFVPSSLSLDLFRAYGLGKEAIPKKHAASSIIVDRILSLFALLTVANLSVLFFYRLIRLPEVMYFTVSVLCLFLTVILFINSRFFDRFIQRYDQLIQKYKILGKLVELHHSIQDYRSFRKQLFVVFLLSLAMQSCRILVYYFASLAVNADVALVYLMVFTPVVMFLVMLPISLAGIGLREGSYIYLLGQIGVPASTAFAISALVSLVVVISILPGGLILAFKGLALKQKTATLESPLVSDTN
jgi:uncharacterized protein (TIRG00374 family)